MADLKKEADAAITQSGFGEPSSPSFNLLHGINHRGTGNIVPKNLDHQGYTFFTKPSLNLSYDNLAAVPKLDYLSSRDANSMAVAIKTMLTSNSISYYYNPSEVRSNIIDDRLNIIPLLTNTIQSCSGWPDFVLDSFSFI